MSRDWMSGMRAAQYATINDAAKAANVSVTLLHMVESGSTTSPEMARRIGDAYHMSPTRVQELICRAALERRQREKCKSVAQRRREGLQQIYR